MKMSQKITIGKIRKNSIGFIFLLVSICCMLILIISTLRLPEISLANKSIRYYKNTKTISMNKDLGKFGEMMLDMLPNDLAFTVFVPSEKNFEGDLKLQVSDSLTIEKMNDTYAIISRILGFSTVARPISSSSVPMRKEIDFDSLSGFKLYISKDGDGMIIVNGVKSRRVDFKRGEIVVHVMDGVIMDAEFEQSVQPDYIEEKT